MRLVEVRLQDMFAVRPAVAAIMEALGPGYVTSDWIQMNESLFSALWLEKVAIGLTIGLIVAVAALNIVATLVLMVMEKHKDIAHPGLHGCFAGRRHADLHGPGHDHRRDGNGHGNGRGLGSLS